MNKVIALLNMKGGVGKTTSSINIATGFANKGYRVLLIDFDPQANSTDILLDIKQEEIFINDEVTEAINMMDSDKLETILKSLNQYDYSETFIDQMLFDPELTTTYQTTVKNLHIIPSRLELAKAEKEIRNGDTAVHNRLKKVVKKVQKEYDYIFIDCPPIINVLTTNVLNIADEIIAPIKIDRGAEKGLIMTIQQLIGIANSYDLDILIRPLFTMVNRNNQSKERLEVLSSFKNDIVRPIDAQIRFQDKPVNKASFDNELIINDQKANVGQDYRDVVDYLDKEWN
ncbi:ParA family protein [Erysipelothrix rhusiopathiae]|nr:ParA family protein [Erysipelothrix rhusiopathiae]MDE8269076.1 ParA family protein [Erysipelothrix rhusiopathiae]MDE8270655.1 ParA family protein [Erysipelothrix rhusiopathiae]MDE8279080.1 ParA family protein [Erysipelothrix rhusiopathiae]MDE8319434.1 ParA family protein [Erysipelothrix rhusiopathiae]